MGIQTGVHVLLHLGRCCLGQALQDLDAVWVDVLGPRLGLDQTCVCVSVCGYACVCVCVCVSMHVPEVIGKQGLVTGYL